MTPWQDNPAMIYICLIGNGIGRQRSPFSERAAAGRAPICLGLIGQHSVALAADSFHT